MWPAVTLVVGGEPSSSSGDDDPGDESASDELLRLLFLLNDTDSKLPFMLLLDIRLRWSCGWLKRNVHCFCRVN